ncbi:hypothetical protein Tco_0424985 [Tanacetum coccineum]
MRNRIFMHTAWDDNLLGTMRFLSRHEDTQIYGAILPKAMTNQAILDSVAYKTYYAIALRAETLESKKSQKKSDSAISSEESPSKKKHAKAKKGVPSTKKPATKPKPTKKKALVKADRGKCLNVLSEVALSETTQLKEATKQSKKDFHISHASGSGDGTNFESGFPDEQQYKISGTYKGTSTKPGVLDVPKYDSKSEKESWGDSGEEDDDDDDDSEEEMDDDKGNDDDDGNNDDDSDDKRTKEETQAEKQEYIDLVDSSVRTIIREEVKTQLPQILPKAVSDFATLVIKRNVTESLEADVLAKSSSQPKSTYEAATSLSEYELTKILLDKME